MIIFNATNGSIAFDNDSEVEFGESVVEVSDHVIRIKSKNGWSDMYEWGKIKRLSVHEEVAQ